MEQGQGERFVWWRSRPYVLLSAILFTSYASAGLTYPLFSLRAQDLGATLLQIGLIGTVGRVVAMLVEYLWGRQSDLLMRRKPLVLIGMGVRAVANWAIALSTGWQPLSWIQGTHALGKSASAVGSLALIGDVLEGKPNRGRLMGLHRGMGSLAFGISALFGGAISDRFGSAMPFYIGGGLLVAAFALGLWLVEAPGPSAPGAPSPTLIATPRRLEAAGGEDRITWEQLLWILPFLVVVFAWFFADASAFSFWPVYMVERGLSKTLVTRLWGIAALGETGAMVLAGYLSDRWGSKRVMGFGIAMMGLLFVGYTLVREIPLLIPMQLVRSIAFSSYTSASMLYATEMGLRKQRGRMAGLQGTSSNLGGIIGALAGGAMSQSLGMATMLRAVGGLMAVVGVVGGLKMRDPRKEGASDGEGGTYAAPTTNGVRT